MTHTFLTAMRWFLFFVWTSICAYTPAAGAMVGDYLSYFNIPPPEPDGHSDTIRNKLLAYINGATPGSEIRGHITTIGHDEIAEALIKANKERGVAVYLVQDGEEKRTPDPSFTPGEKLAEHFGHRHKFCYADRGAEGSSLADLTSCVSSVFLLDDSGDEIEAATHHIKNWMFSNTVVNGKTRTHSTWVTSYNLTGGSDRQFNDVFIVNDNKELYAAYVESFKNFFGQRRTDDFYNVAGRGHHVIPSANTEISYSPNQTSDPVAEALSKARIDRYEPGCSLKVANLSISSSRRAITSELHRIRALGCRVQIAFTKAHGTALNLLTSGDLEVRASQTTTIHSKMMLYKGRYDGTPGRTFVWGGSHNWNWESLRMNDEVFVAISRLGIYKSYSDYFDAIWARSQSLTVNITHVNNFGFEGWYDRANHTYRAEWIRDVVLDPRTRPIEAVGCVGLPLTRIPQESIEDGNPPPCGDRLARIAPPGVTAVRWTLRGPHPISGNVVDLTTDIRQLLRLRPIVGSNCIPIEAPLVLSLEDCTFKTSPSTVSRTIFPARYTVRYEAINSTNQVLRSGSAEVSVPRNVPLIVSVGDSLASGEGNPDRVGQARPDNLNPNGRDCERHTSLMIAQEKKPAMFRQPVCFDSRDHRSLLSAPARAARELLSEWPYIIFLSFAKSGSEVTAEDSDNDLLEQLTHVQRVVGNHKIDALLISIGGNDVGFANTLTGLTLGDRFGGLSGPDALSEFTEKLVSLREDRYPLINESIERLQLNVSKVVINEYPASLFNRADNKPAKGCGVFAGPAGLLSISEGEAKNINSMGILLNAEVKVNASIHGWHLVNGIADQFESRGYCSGASLYVFAQVSCQQQGDFDGTMHPNVEGTQIIARAFARELRSILPRPPEETPDETETLLLEPPDVK